MTAVVERSDLLTDVGWEAARIWSGDLSPQDASPDAVLLAAQAAAAADRDVMDDIVEHQQAGHTPSGNAGPRVSDAGSCPRKIWYRETPPAGYTPVPVTIYNRHAALGQIIHNAAAAARAARYPWRRYEFEVTIPGLTKKGRLDEYDPVTGEIIDDKTVGSRKWEMVGPDGPLPEQWDQVLIYGLAVDAIGLPVRTVTIIFINRENGAEERHSRPYDPVAASDALDRLIDVAVMLDLGIEPERARRGPAVDFECRVCPAQGHCWNVPAATAAGRSPESYTTLGPTPAPRDVVWAGLNAIEKASTRLAAEKEEKAAKILIQGLPPDTYVDDDGNQVVIDTSWHTSIGYKEAWETTRDLLALPAEYQPESAPSPKATKTKSTVAKPVRAATKAKAVKAKA